MFKFFWLTSIFLLVSCSSTSNREKVPPFMQVELTAFDGDRVNVEVFQSKYKCPKKDSGDEYHTSCITQDGSEIFLKTEDALAQTQKLARNYCKGSPVDVVAYKKGKDYRGIGKVHCSNSLVTPLGGSSTCTGGEAQYAFRNTITFKCLKRATSTFDMQI